MKRILLLVATHLGAGALGFALGIYALPILIAEPAPDAEVLEAQADAALYSAALSRDLRGSDGLHWGEGTISVSPNVISHVGKLAPGPDYRLYLTREFVEHEDEFAPIKSDAALIGQIKSYDGFALDVPAGVNIEDYTSVVVWCETFDEFITAGTYR
jgi:hypothetical protein